MPALCVQSRKHNKRAHRIPSLLPTSLSVSFFTFLDESATSAVTHRPASQQVSVRLQYRHITTRQFFDGLHFPPLVSKGHGYLSAVDHSDQMTDTTSVSAHRNSLRGPSGCRARFDPAALKTRRCSLFTIRAQELNSIGV